MRTKSVIIFILLISCLHSCVKDPQDIPGDMTTDPVFGLNGIFGTTPISIDAGHDGWTVQPVVEGTDSLQAFTSIFSKSGCLDNCSPSFEFRFYKNLESSNGYEADFLQTIQAGAKEFIKSGQERDSFLITMSTADGLFMNGYSSWLDLNDTFTTFHSEFVGTIGYQQSLNVCFQSFAFTGCQYSQCIYFDPATLVPCLSWIEPKFENDRFLSLTVRPQGTPPFKIEWQNLNAPYNDSAAMTIILPIADSVSEIYAAVKVTDALGNYSMINQTIRIQYGFVDACYFPITLSSVLINDSQSSAFEDKAEILYRDENGHTWTSSGGVQLTNAQLFITGVDYFGLSPSGQPTYKTTLSFSVTLFNATTGESRDMVIQHAVLPLSHR